MKKYFPYIYLILLNLIIVYFYFGKVLLCPNNTLLGNGKDGIKNYYTYAYYIKNNKSIVNFEGFNYPHGDYFVYADGHSALAITLKTLKNVFPIIENHSIGILNSILLIAPVLTALFLFLIFKHLKLNDAFAIIGATAITFLSPQIFRITAHYSLSYSFVIPSIIYLLLVLGRSYKSWINLLLTFVIILYYYTHTYLGLVCSMIVLLYFLISLRSKTKPFYLLIPSLFPPVLFLFLSKIFDNHPGRTNNPWGVTEFHADLETVFLPIYGPLNYFKSLLFGSINQTWEGWSYIGFATVCFVIFLLFKTVSYSIKNKTISIDKTIINSSHLRKLLVVSTIILLFSMLIPFRFNLLFLLDYVPFIKQFRSLGRFAWVFYYVSTISLVYFCYHSIYFKYLKKNKALASLSMLVPLTFFAEGYKYHENVSKAISTKNSNIFSPHQLDKTLLNTFNSIDINKYQAILAFPFYYGLSENYSLTPNEKDIYVLSMALSYHTGLPQINNYSARASIPESKAAMQLLAYEFYPKALEDKFASNKEILIICLNHVKLSPEEKHYIQKANLVLETYQFNLYSITPSSFFNYNYQKNNNILSRATNSFKYKDGFYIKNKNSKFIYKGFNQTSQFTLSKDGEGYSGKQKEINVLLHLPPHSLDNGKTYQTRFWVYNMGENYGQDQLKGRFFIQQENETNKLEWLNPFVKATSSHQIFGDWSLVQVPLENYNENYNYKLLYQGDQSSTKQVYIDELLLFEKGDTIVKIYKDSFLLNNHIIKRIN